MTDQEKKILEMLDTATDEIEIPESLEPENIEKKLEAKKIKKWKRPYRYALAAACVAAAVGIGAVYQGTGGFEHLGGASGTSKYEAGSRGDQNLPVSEHLVAAESYDEISDYIAQYTSFMERDVYYAGDTGNDGAIVEDSSEEVKTSSAADMGTGEAEGDTGGYSDTNVRTEGVGEADIVKTDGTYLYALKENGREIAIVDTTKNQMKVVSLIQIDENSQISEFYVSGDQLFVLSTGYTEIADTDDVSYYDTQSTQLAAYDISDITAPSLAGWISQSGYYQTSRFVDGYLYIFSNFSVYGRYGAKEENYFIPAVDGKILDASSIYLPPIHSANQYLVITAVKADDPNNIVDQKAVLSEEGQCYVSADNIYIYESTWCDNPMVRSDLSTVNRTVIRKLSYKNGKLNGEAQGKVKGWLNDSFSIDEYDGNLRLVTTVDGAVNTTNAVYVLDEDLKLIGKITDLAKGERVYSARMFGKTGYFVTYRETDPLFSVDFTDPENPQIIGTLKIPGFSEYLHFYGENLLLGIGMDTDEESGVTNGVKLSMFDISDPSDVKEIQKYTISTAYYASVFDDYRAVMIDKEKNMIGFDTNGNSDMYYIFSYDKTNGFNLEMAEEVNGSGWLGVRGVYIQDKFYVVKGNAVESYRMGSFEKVDDLLL